MNLYEFIEKFVEANSLVRLVRAVVGGHEVVMGSWNDVFMEHDILNKKENAAPYIESKVVGLASIYAIGHYPEAINIVIE